MTLLRPAVQRGGSPDLDGLWDELANWSGYYVEAINPTASYGSHDRDGHRSEDQVGSFHARGTDAWCIQVEQDGWEPRDRWLMWGDSIKDAADKLAEFMRVRRLNPHLTHIEAHAFYRYCADCRSDHEAWFPDAEWDVEVYG